MSSTIRAHFDGQNLVPDEPLIGLVPGDALRVTIERAAPPPEGEDASPTRRKAGSARGQVWMSPDFDEPLDDFKDYM